MTEAVSTSKSQSSDYTVQHPRRQSPSYSTPGESEISFNKIQIPLNTPLPQKNFIRLNAYKFNKDF
jgi:hypothetical protein